MGDQIVHNAIFYGMSNNSFDQYPSNKASNFTNNLKNRIVLDANVKYNVNLHNFHVPLHEVSLAGNDFYESNLQYNIGLFFHDPQSHFGGYILDKTTVKKLFNLAPNRDIQGIYTQNCQRQMDHDHPMSNIEEKDMVGGKPAFRSHKESFMHLLGMSLQPNKNESMETRIMEQNNLSIFKRELSKARGVSHITSNLLGKYYSDLDYFLFDDFTFLPQTVMAYFVGELLRNTGYAHEDVLYFMSQSGQLDNEMALTLE